MLLLELRKPIFEIIRKVEGGYRIYSRKKGPGGKRRNLGTYPSIGAAKEREKQIQRAKYAKA